MNTPRAPAPRPFDDNSARDLLTLRRVVAGVEASPHPKLLFVRSPRTGLPWVVVLAGSFNPPTTAHLAL
ncbi:MAG: hypothetical protein NZ518_05235, partial [Dehalococcoidia bacterium]|nr:hypothetical protein [Dehalococcoidia bacterium]